MKKTIYIFIISIFLLQIQLVFARHAKIEDLAFVFDKSQLDITLNSDGSSVQFEQFTARIQHKEGIKFLGTYKFTYLPNLEEVEVVDAFVDNEGVITKVAPNAIQKNTIASKNESLINLVEVAIVFPQVKENSIVHLKLKKIVKKNDLSQIFSDKYKFGDKTVEYNSRLKITSPYKLFYHLNDPQKIIKITESLDNKGQNVFEATMVGPYLNLLIGELGVLPNHLVTSLDVSNVKDWNKIVEILSAKISADQNEKLPEELQAFLKGINAKLTTEEKVNQVLVYITKNYRYTGDWRNLYGMIYPKKLEQLVKDKYGDCKDFSKLLAKLLNSLNIKTDLALVNRSRAKNALESTSLPSLKAFNHMIARVQIEDKVFWVDPTNNFSVGLKTREDINNRLALNLSLVTNPLEYIEVKKNLSKEATLNKAMSFISATDAEVELNFNLSGENAFITQDILANKKQQEVEEVFLKLFGRNEKQVTTDFSYNGNSGEYRPIEVKAKYKASEMGEKNKQTNKFEMLMPIVPELAALSMINEGTEGEINLSLLPKVKNEYTYNNIFITGELPAICEIKSTWLNASRKVDLLKNGFKLTDLVEVTKDYLTKDLYGSNDFAIILNNVQRCFFNNKISYGFGLSGHKVASEEFEKSLSKLNLKDRLNKRLERAYKILSAASGRSDNTVEPTEFARLLLERNLKEDEKHLDSYVAMAFYLRISGYLNNENYDSNALKQSLSVLDKALSFDPTFIDAWASKAKSHYFSREYPLAQEILTQKILTYDKSKIRFGALSNIVQLLYLLNDPENAEAYAKLAIIKAKKKEDQSSIYNSQADYFANQKDYKKCILFYQKSLEVDNLQHWMHGNLSSCYTRNNQFDLAIKSAESAIAIKDYGMAHTHLAQAYLGKGNELARQKNYKDAEGMYSQSLLNFEHWETYLQLMSVSVRLQKMDRALDAAQKAIAIYEGSTEVIVGIIAKLFDQRSDEYSSFMEKVLTEVKSESRTSELMYYVSYSLGMKNLKKEATKWALKGLDLTTRIVKKRSPEAESLDEYVMLANYHLLALWLNNDMEQLEKANEVYNIVAKIDEANPKVKNLNRYIQDANEKIGRRPASVKKKYK